MASAHAVSEGYMPFRGLRTWYRVVGDPAWDAERAPMMVLHGGPGATHDYLEDLARLADGRRRVILYNQLGAGNSDIRTIRRCGRWRCSWRSWPRCAATWGWSASTCSANPGVGCWAWSTR